MDDQAIEAIVSMVMDLQDRENTSLPLYEQQLREAETGIQNLLNAIYLYDDKLVLTFNYKDGTRTITLDDVKEAAKAYTGSDLDCRGAPKKRARQGSLFWCGRGSNPFNQQSCGLLVNAGWTAFTPYMNTSHWLFGPVGCVAVSVKLPHNLHLHFFFSQSISR